MKNYNPFRILRDLETGRLETYPIGIRDVLCALIAFFLHGFILGRILLTAPQYQIGESLFAIVKGLLMIAVLVIVCKEIFFYENEERSNINNKLSIKAMLYGILMLIAGVAFLNIFNILIIRNMNISIFIEAIRAILSQNYITGIIYICLLGPFVEELIFRGILLNSMLKRFNKSIAIILSTVIFAVIHFIFVQIIAALILGTILGVIYAKYRSIVLCFIAHALNNSIFLIIFFNDDILTIYKSQNIYLALACSTLSLFFIIFIYGLMEKENMQNRAFLS